MKNIILILLIMITSIFSQEVEKNNAFDIFGGWSIPYDDGNDETSYGFNGGISYIHEVYNHISVGGLLALNHWNESLYIPFLVDIEATLQIKEALCLIRASTKRVSGGYAFVQFGMGAFMESLEVEIDGDTDISTENNFGMSLSGGLVINKFLLYPSYQYVFGKDKDKKWMRVSLGFSL